MEGADRVLKGYCNTFFAILILADGRLRMVISPLVDLSGLTAGEAKDPTQSGLGLLVFCFFLLLLFACFGTQNPILRPMLSIICEICCNLGLYTTYG